MNIYLDNIVFSKSNNGGISNYWFELSNYLLENKNDKLLFFDKKNYNNYHRNKLHLEEGMIIPTPDISPLLSRMLPIFFKTDEKLLYHSSFYRRLIGCKNQVEITTIHDFTHDYYFPFVKRKLHNQLKYSAIQRAKGIICVSHNTYNDLQKFCPTKKSQKVSVIYNGVSDDYFQLDRTNDSYHNFIEENQLDCNYILYVGSRADYKNFKFTVNLIKEIPEMNLIIVGNPLSNHELKWIGSDALSKIKVLSNVEDSKLNVLYNFAYAFIYPSAYEGFGIPIIEAMKAGCPVLTLNNSSITEVAGQGALLFDSANVDDFKRGLAKLANNDFKSQLLENGLLQSEKFSWEKCTRETYDFYEQNYFDE